MLKPYRPDRPARKPYHLQLTKEERAKLDLLAKRWNRTVADVLRELLRGAPDGS